MGNTYFFKLFKHNKFLFILVFGFISGQFFFTYKQVETVPFFNYGMYSESCIKKELYPTISLYKDNKRIPLDQLGRSPIFLEYQLHNYAQLISQDSVDFTKVTIYKRFGRETDFSKYLVRYLTCSKKSIELFPAWVEKWTSEENISIVHENYAWTNNSFELVNSKILH